MNGTSATGRTAQKIAQNASRESQNNRLLGSGAALINFEQQLRRAGSPVQLQFAIVNLLQHCLPYTQAILLLGEDYRHQKAVAVSNLPVLEPTSPFITLAEDLCSRLSSQEGGLQTISATRVEPELQSRWQPISPDHLFIVPLRVAARDNQLAGTLLLFRTEGWSEGDRVVVSHLSGSIAHALFTWQQHQPLRHRLRRGMAWLHQPRRATIAALAVVGLLLIPVQLSVLAPFKVIAKDPFIVAAPIKGAVEKVLVRPNQPVQTGDMLVQIKDTELDSEYQVARQARQVAEAELKTAQQSSFLDPGQKARIAELESRVNLRQSELDYARARLERARITAPRAGIAVLGDPGEWSGRPVATGERILLLANPASVEIEIMLPVKDAITLAQQGEVSLFPDSSPLSSIPANLLYTGYEPRRTPEQQLAYRLVASLDPSVTEKGNMPRIGARGTAKVYGETVTLFFYLFRRPITYARQWLGW